MRHAVIMLRNSAYLWAFLCFPHPILLIAQSWLESVAGLVVCMSASDFRFKAVVDYCALLAIPHYLVVCVNRILFSGFATSGVSVCALANGR